MVDKKDIVMSKDTLSDLFDFENKMNKDASDD